ncbi:MAG TPA: RagB/SusD family nutrient uptake outer membrane protein, partial [Puia sp.]
GGYTVGYPSKPPDGSTEQSDRQLFLQNRRHRLNYYAVCGELARVYLYNNDKPNALRNAQEVINSGKFPWTDQADFINVAPEQIDRICYKELIFAWYIPNQMKQLQGLFETDVNGFYLNMNDGQSIYETGGVGAFDLRYKEWFKIRTDASGSRLNVQKYVRDADSNRHPLVAPALRLSEVFYIAAECMYDNDPATATAYVDAVRFHRGIGTAMTASSKEDFLDQLVKEARKEFFAEGQIFYLYKRLNKPIVGQSGQVYPVGNNVFVLPLPNDETEFGNR